MTPWPCWICLPPERLDDARRLLQSMTTAAAPAHVVTLRVPENDIAGWNHLAQEVYSPTGYVPRNTAVLTPTVPPPDLIAHMSPIDRPFGVLANDFDPVFHLHRWLTRVSLVVGLTQAPNWAAARAFMQTITLNDLGMDYPQYLIENADKAAMQRIATAARTIITVQPHEKGGGRTLASASSAEPFRKRLAFEIDAVSRADAYALLFAVLQLRLGYAAVETTLASTPAVS